MYISTADICFFLPWLLSLCSKCNLVTSHAHYSCSSYITFKNCLATSASNGSLIEWKMAIFHKEHFFIRSSDRKMPISDFQCQFSMSKIIRTFLNLFSMKNINLGTCFFVVDIFWKLHFSKDFVYWNHASFWIAWFRADVPLTKIFFHSIKLPFDADVAEKISNVI